MTTRPAQALQPTSPDMAAYSSRIGCQTYTWEMLGDGWTGQTTDVLDAIAASGYAGLELTLRMAGEFRAGPRALRSACAMRDLTLRTLAFSTPTGFTDPDHLAAEVASADLAIDWALSAGCHSIGLGGATDYSHSDRRQAHIHAANVYNTIARRAVAAGLVAHIHPSSHHGSVIETIDDYDAILALTDPTIVSFGPDTGHLIRGGIDPLPYLERYWERVTHLHIKDVSATNVWAIMGDGVCDVVGIMALLHDRSYSGWVMLEEEADAARADPAAAVARNRAWLQRVTGM